MATYMTRTGADGKSARCVITAESPWVILRGGSPGARRKNRPWRTEWTTRYVGSVALLSFPAESTGHTEKEGACAKLPRAAPSCAPLLGYYRGGCSPLWRGGDQRGRKSWATTLPSSCRSQRVERSRKPITANQFGREPRRQRRLGYLSAGVDCPYEKLPNFRTQCRLWRGFSVLFSVAFFHSVGTETERSKEVGRRCYFETVGSVVALPESASSGSGETNIGEESFRQHRHSVFPPGLTRTGGQKATFANQLR